MTKCVFCEVINDDANYDVTVTCFSSYVHREKAVFHHWYCKKCLNSWLVKEDKSMFIKIEDTEFNFQMRDTPSPRV